MRDRALGSTIRIYFTTHTLSTGVVVAPSSALAAADFRIYKDGSATEKATTNGITVTSPFNSVAGTHLIEIDTSNSTGDSGFWASGSAYRVVINTAKTVDSKNPSGVCVGEFSIELQTADVRKIGGAAQSATDLKDFADTGYDPVTHALTEAVELDSATLTKIDGIKTKTDTIPASPAAVGSEMTLTTAYDAAKTAASQTSVNDLPTNAELATALAAADDATLTAIADVQTDVDAANNYLSALSTVFSGITSLANWLRRGFRKDTGSAGMITAQSEINTGGTATFSGTTDSLEAIRDNQASSSGASLEDIIAGVQSVSGGIIAAQDSSAFYITSGDTWTQDVDDLGNIVGKTLVFTIKRNARDADTAALVLINSTDGLTRLVGAAASNSAWGSLDVLDDTLGNIRLTLESDATLLLNSGTYADGIKSLEDGDDRTLRQRGKTIISVGVIDDIS